MSEPHAGAPAVADGGGTRLCLLGTPGAGKTCFLAGLAVLADPDADTALRVHPEDLAGLRLFTRLRGDLRGGRWPAKTVLTEPVVVSVRRDGHAATLRVMDYGGEALREQFAAGTGDHATAEVRAHVLGSEAAVLVLDPERDLDAAADEARRTPVQALHEIRRAAGVTRPLDVAVVLSKADRLPELSDPRAARRFLARQAPGLWTRLNELGGDGAGGRVGVFPVTAVGRATPPGEPPPPDPRPDGYDALFAWLLRRRIRRARWAKWGAAVLAAAAVSGVVTFGWGTWRVKEKVDTDRRVSVAADPATPTETLVGEAAPDAPAEVAVPARENLDAKLDALETRLSDALGEAAVRDVLRELAPFLKATPVIRVRAEGLREAAREKLDDLAFARVRDAYGPPTAANFPAVAADYLQGDTARAHAGTVRGWMEIVRRAEWVRDRRRIAALPAGSPDGLRAKADAIDAHVAAFPEKYTDLGTRRLRRAADLARRFGGRARYEVTLVRSGGLASPRDHALFVSVGGKRLQKFTSNGEVRGMTWNESFPITWRSGETVGVELFEYEYGDESVAWFTADDPLALRLFHGRQSPTRWAGDWRSDSPDLFLECAVTGITDEDWDVLRRYIDPGASWESLPGGDGD